MTGRAAARAREAPTTRDAILDAAERLFAERGFDGVSMREIAAEAGLRNQASLYHHFRDKRALYEAVLERGVDEILSLTAGDATDAPEPNVDLLFEYLAAHPHLPRLLQRAGLDDDRYLRDAVPRLLRPLYAQGIEALARTGGPWAADDLPHVAMGLYHLIFGYFADAPLLAEVAGSDPRSPAAVARQRRFLATAVRLLLGVPAREASGRLDAARRR